MKAFSAEIFTDQAQEELIKEAKSLLAQNPKYIRSILEAEDDCIVRELQLKRDAYISLIESQKQDLGLINEAAGINMTTGIMVAIIALISYIITGIILGKKDSVPSPSETYKAYHQGYNAGKSYQKTYDDAKQRQKEWEEWERNWDKQYEEYRKAYSYPKKGDILISAAGTIGRTVVYNGEDAYYQDSNIVWIDNDESIILNKYLLYCYLK